MLCRLPSSRARLRLRLSPVDVVLAAVSPVAALYLRNADVASNGDWVSVGSYTLVSLGFSLIAFQISGISSVISRYISVSDLLNIAKVVLASEVMTGTVLFTVSRLAGIPRSVPTIHALILGAALVAYRGLAYITGKQGRHADQVRSAPNENVMLIGLSDWSVILMKYLQAQAPDQRVVAVLDEDLRWIGRSVNGVQVFGPPTALEAVIEEFATHGLRTDRVIVGGEPSELSFEALAGVRDVCAQRDIDLVFVPRISALDFAEHNCLAAHKGPGPLTGSNLLPSIRPSSYFCFKRLIDAIIALILIFTLLPLLVVTGLLVFFDIGWPVLFWQQRTGRGGRELQLYKFRTLRPPFDGKGQRIPEEKRFSGIGRLLRKTHLDELPQLLNVLVGDMSLIGPRPLLPRDQPPNSAPRLAVRPGITGWAQVNGGILLSAMEKDALDVWYIRNASLWLDLRIIGMTFASFVKGDRRSEEALAQAVHWRCHERGLTQADKRWSAPADERHLDDADQHSAIRG